MSRTTSILFSMAAYVITLAIIVVTFRYTEGYPVLIRIAVSDLTGTVVIFLFSLIMNNSSMYDPYWSVKPFVIAAYYFYMVPAAEVTLVEVAALALVFLYALRLTTNFYRGWPGMKHEDWRYRDFRDQFPGAYWLVSFFGIHFFPTVMVYLGCLPMIVIFGEPVRLPWLAYAGILVTLGSVLLAFIADEQLRKYRLNPANAGKSIRTGLWSRSRHPNYLGEILTWWGLFLMGLASGLQYWWTGIGALVITLMFVFISIPLIEKYSLRRRSDYKEYKREVPFLLPLKF